MKFSIIVPVYNVEEYISKCLESIKVQTFKDFEVIIVNDGSTDKSQEIIDKYVKENPDTFKSFIKENSGPSDTRNYGVKQSIGEYIIFIDSDDYIDNNYLEVINKKITDRQDLDILRISIKKIYENGSIRKEEKLDEIECTGEQAFYKSRKEKIEMDLPWSYCIKSKYWKENNFLFPSGKLHEDFAILPIMIIKAKKIGFINGTYYTHLFRANSIMRNKNFEIQKANDILYHYDTMLRELDRIDNISEKTRKMFLEFISTAVFQKINKLEGEEKRKYIKEVKKRKVIKNIKFYEGFSIRILEKKILYFFMLIQGDLI